MRKQVEHYQPDYIIVDYIQLMISDNPSSDRNAEMQAIVRELKSLASDCNISVIGLSQLHRCLNNTSYFLSPDIFRELFSDELEDINLTCIHRSDYIYLLFKHETIEFSMFPSVIYIHRLSSSRVSSTVGYLRKLLPQYEVLSPDLPTQPQEAFTMLTELCKLYKPEFIIGTSIGGIFVQQLRG